MGAPGSEPDPRRPVRWTCKRFKTDIRDLDDVSSAVMRLRPVAFKYKPEVDPSGGVQYGLIAEEVATVFPALVAYDKDGNVETVKYHLLPTLLLDVLQRDHAQLQEAQARTAQLEHALAEQAQQIQALTAEVRQAQAQSQRIETLTAHLAQLEAAMAAPIQRPALAASDAPGNAVAP